MKILFVYLVIINLLSLFLMAEDKRRARRHLWRIPERTLFAAALVGGSVGALLSMYLFHHKTRHWSFVVGMPLFWWHSWRQGTGCWRVEFDIFSSMWLDI